MIEAIKEKKENMNFDVIIHLNLMFRLIFFQLGITTMDQFRTNVSLKEGTLLLRLKT